MEQYKKSKNLRAAAVKEKVSYVDRI